MTNKQKKIFIRFGCFLLIFSAVLVAIGLIILGTIEHSIPEKIETGLTIFGGCFLFAVLLFYIGSELVNLDKDQNENTYRPYRKVSPDLIETCPFCRVPNELFANPYYVKWGKTFDSNHLAGYPKVCKECLAKGELLIADCWRRHRRR